MTRRDARSYGSHGATVNCWLEDGRVWCEWRDSHKKKHTRSWPEDKAAEARRWAQLYATERTRLKDVEGPIPTLQELWPRYRSARGHSWRPKTLTNYGAWMKQLATLTKPIDQIDHDDLDALQSTLRERGIEHGTIQRAIGFVRQMLTFAVGRKYLAINPVATYKYVTPKSERGAAPAEYTRDDVARMIAALDRPSQWRARVMLKLGATFGARVNALRHLQWADVNFDTNTVTFRHEWDKTGETFTRPMPDIAREALLEAFNQRHNEWVFWSPRHAKPITYNALHYHLLKAEQRAGIEHKHKRAFHGERRLVVGDLGLELGGEWINHKKLATTQTYMRERPEKLEKARNQIGK